MGFLDRLFGRGGKAAAPDHAVIVNFQYGSQDLARLHALEEELEGLIAEAGVGELDGNEIAVDGSEGSLFMYGPNADALYAAIRPRLEATDFMRGAKIVLRYGPPEDDVREVEHVLGG